MDPESIREDDFLVTLLTSEYLSDNFKLDVKYNEDTSVFLVEAFNADFYFTLDWSDNIQEYTGSGQLRCTVCDTTDVFKYRTVRTARISGTLKCMDMLDESHIGDTQLVVCENCAKNIESLAEEIAKKKSGSFLSDTI